MTLSRDLRNLVLLASLFSSGVGLYLAQMNVRGALKGDVWLWFYGMSRLGYAIVVMLIAELVSKTDAVPLAWRSYLYTAGLLLCSVGFVGIGLHQRRTGGEL